MISAYERFFGGPESAGAGRLVRGREGKALLLPFVPVPPTLGLAGFTVSRGAGLFKSGRDVDTGLSLEFPSCRSAGRGAGFCSSPFVRGFLSPPESVRAALVLAVRSSSSAFRLGNAALDRGAGFGSGAGFSPVIDASKSRI